MKAYSGICIESFLAALGMARGAKAIFKGSLPVCSRHGFALINDVLLNDLTEISMSAATIKLSSNSQSVIPKEIRDELHWQAGTQLIQVSSPSGVTLKAATKKRKQFGRSD